MARAPDDRPRRSEAAGQVSGGGIPYSRLETSVALVVVPPRVMKSFTR